MSHGFHAIPDEHRRGFLAQYTTSKGAAYVRDAAGAAVLFKTEQKAESAAMRALCKALGRGTPRVCGNPATVRRTSRFVTAASFFRERA